MLIRACLRFAWALVAGIACAGLIGAARGQSTPTLVGDLTQTRVFSASHALRTATLGPGLSLLVATNADASDPLLVTDGTTAGTVPIAPGTLGSHRPITGKLLPIADGLVLFRTADSGFTESLWRTDGTTGGTVSIATFQSSGSRLPRLFTRSGAGYVFVAISPQGLTQLWFTDGTASGTRMTGELTPTTGNRPSLSIVPVEGGLVLVDGAAQQVFVASEDGSGAAAVQFPAGQPFADFVSAVRVNGRTVFTSRLALWAVEAGSSTATRLQTFDFTTGPIVNVGDAAVYFARTSATRNRLWRTDGTAAGTVAVRDESTTFVFYAITPFDGRAAFVRHTGTTSELGITNGTTAGTDIFPTLLTPSSLAISYSLRSVGDRIWAWNALGTPVNLYSSDGTATGTVQVLSSPTGERFQASRLVDAPGGVLFTRSTRGMDGGVTHEVIASDGTPTGTRTIRTLTNTALAPSSFTVPIGRLGTGASAPVLLATSADDAGGEPWVTDITAAGTMQVADLNTETDGSDLEPIAINDGVVVLARRLPGKVIDIYRLRDNQLTFVRSFSDAEVVERSVDTPLWRMGFVRVNRPTITEVWTTDGTSAGTQQVYAGTPLGQLRFLADLAGRAVLQVPGFPQWRLLTTDGTSPGTSLFAVASRVIGQPIRQGDRFIFAYALGPAGPRLIVSDGTEAGTQTLLDIASTGFPTVLPIAATHDALYANASMANASGVVRIAGTPPTVTPIISPRVLAGIALGDSLIAIRDTLFGRELVRIGTDDTVTVLSTAAQFVPEELFAIGERVVVVANRPDQSSALVVTDGTLAGTIPVTVGSTPLIGPSGLTAIGRKVYFTAGTAGFGREPWVLDVDQSFARRVADLRIGPGDSSPDWFALDEQRVYFSAAGARVGTELWSVPTCSGDFNGSGSASVEDVLAFLEAWFARSPRGDTNADGRVSIQDLFDFISNWTSGC